MEPHRVLKTTAPSISNVTSSGERTFNAAEVAGEKVEY